MLQWFRSSGILTGSKTPHLRKYCLSPFRSSGVLTGSKTNRQTVQRVALFRSSGILTGSQRMHAETMCRGRFRSSGMLTGSQRGRSPLGIKSSVEAAFMSRSYLPLAMASWPCLSVRSPLLPPLFQIFHRLRPRPRQPWTALLALRLRCLFPCLFLPRFVCALPCAMWAGFLRLPEQLHGLTGVAWRKRAKENRPVGRLRWIDAYRRRFGVIRTPRPIRRVRACLSGRSCLSVRPT